MKAQIFFRARLSVLAIFLLSMGCPLYAITHHVDDFRLDSIPNASDTANHLATGWGDTLLIAAKNYTYTTVLDSNMSSDTLPNSFTNGFSGASPVATCLRRNQFKVAYLAFNLPVHSNPLTAPPQLTLGPIANIATRGVFFNSSVALIDSQANVIADKEGINPPQEPFFLNFSAVGKNYAAYWGPMLQNMPIRRTTNKDTTFGDILHGWGKNLQDRPIPTPAVIDSAGGWGMVSASMVPGTGGQQSVVAVDTKKGANFCVKVRWEDIENETSTSVLGPTRTLIPSDLAIAADSSGNSVVLWREVNSVYALGYNSAHAVTLDTIKLLNSVYYSDVAYTHDIAPLHFYRPYAITSVSPNHYLVVYSKAGIIYYQTLFIPNVANAVPVLGPATGISNVFEFSLYPDISVNGDQAVVAWFEKTPDLDKFLMRGTIFKLVGNDLDITTNVFKQKRFTHDTISFAGHNLAWKATHYLKSASVAIDDQGNVMTAYDNGYKAKISLISNTATYFDTAIFQSRYFRVRNPGILGYVIQAGVDSIRYDTIANNDTAKVSFFLESSKDSLFTNDNTGFQPLVNPQTTSHEYYRYSVLLRSSVPDIHRNTPKLKSLDLNINIKPLPPTIDSIKTGKSIQVGYNSASAYTLLLRKDSLKLVVSGFDLDDVGLTFQVLLENKVLKSKVGTKTGPGFYKATLTFLPPDTVLNPLKLIVNSLDPGGWTSLPDTISIIYKNSVPVQNLQVIRSRGHDVGRVFKPTGGGLDTLTPTSLGIISAEIGDTLTVKATYADLNDDTITSKWKKNKNAFDVQKVLIKDTLTFQIPIDTISPLIDTITVTVGDKDTTSIFKFLVRPNRLPVIDSVAHTGYKKLDSNWVFKEFDFIKKFSTDTGLIVPLGLITQLTAGTSDADQVFNDSVQLRWNIWKKKFATCPNGDLTCYQITDSTTGNTFIRKYNLTEEILTLRATDLSGAFIEQKVKLKYPVLDTGKSTASGLGIVDLILNGKINFILGTASQDTVVTATIKSAGSMPLRIDSVKTLLNDQGWLSISLNWKTGNNLIPKNLVIDTNTDENQVHNSNTISLDPTTNPDLNIGFKFNSKNLKGDSVLSDTLLVFTNDFSKDTLKIPFRMKYDDLPRMRISVPGASPVGSDTDFNAKTLPAFMPARSKLAFTFSEPVRMTDSTAIKIYSYLDSLKNPKGYRFIKGKFQYVRKTTNLANGLGKKSAVAAVGAIAAAADTSTIPLADTIFFTPTYDRAGDSLKVKPGAEYFIYRDVLHIDIKNSITDRAGNNLDLRLNRIRQKVGAFDTIFTAKIDTGFFKVLQTNPEANAKNWNPDLPLRIHFNRKLSQRPPIGNDTSTLLDLKSLQGDSNRFLKITSAFQGTKRFNFQFISLTDGDSSILIKTKPRIPALDTVTVALSGGLLDTSGLSLDGNGNKFPDWLYAPSDSADMFIFTFITRAQDFYVYPNPFKFSDSRHREKGTVTFKNINSLDGFIPGKEIVLRIHTMIGELVYNSHTSRLNQKLDLTLNTSIDWDMKNLAGNLVGTGVYIFTISNLEDKLLHKGKVAVVR